MPSSASLKWFPRLANAATTGALLFQDSKNPSSHRILRASVAVLAAVPDLLAINPFSFRLFPPKFPLLQQTKHHTRKRRAGIQKALFLECSPNIAERLRLLKEAFFSQSNNKIRGTILFLLRLFCRLRTRNGFLCMSDDIRLFKGRYDARDLFMGPIDCYRCTCFRLNRRLGHRSSP